MEEQFMKGILEMGIVAGGFVYLLYFMTSKIGKTMDNVNLTLLEIQSSLSSMNERISKLEDSKRRDEEK